MASSRKISLVAACNECVRSGRECTGRRPSCRLCHAYGLTCRYTGLSSPYSSGLSPYGPDEDGLDGRRHPVVTLAAISGFVSELNDGDDDEWQVTRLLEVVDYARTNLQFAGFQIVPSDVTLIASPMYDSVDGYKSLRRAPRAISGRHARPERRMGAEGVVGQIPSLSMTMEASAAKLMKVKEHSSENTVRGMVRIRFCSSSFGTRKARNRWRFQKATEILYKGPPYNQNEAYDRRILQAQVRQWDVKYLDDGHFHSVLHSYFTWDHPSNAIFDEEKFLDMLSQGPSEQYSLLLMHSVLAFASKNYLIKDPRAVAIEKHALAECERLWLNGRRTTCGDAAAGILLYTIAAANETGDNGRHILETSLLMLQDLGLFGRSQPTSVPLVQEMAKTAWAACAFHIFALMDIHEAAFLTHPPSTPLPMQRNEENQRMWTPDPLQISPRPYESNSIAQARGTLCVVVANIIPLHRHFAGQHDGHVDAATDVHVRLLDWRDKLPFPLECLDKATPQLLLLHAQYNQALIELFGPLASNEYSIEATATDAVMEALRILYAIAFSYDRQYAAQPIPVGFMAPLIHASYGAMRAISVANPQVPDAKFYFRLCTGLLLRMAGPFPVIKEHLTKMTVACGMQGVGLPPALQETTSK